MTDTRSPRRMDDDQQELLAELDELLPDSNCDEQLLCHSVDGAIAFGQDADIPVDDLGELEALFDTFYEEEKEVGSEGEIGNPGSGSVEDFSGDDEAVALGAGETGTAQASVDAFSFEAQEEAGPGGELQPADPLHKVVGGGVIGPDHTGVDASPDEAQKDVGSGQEVPDLPEAGVTGAPEKEAHAFPVQSPDQEAVGEISAEAASAGNDAEPLEGTAEGTTEAIAVYPVVQLLEDTGAGAVPAGGRPPESTPQEPVAAVEGTVHGDAESPQSGVEGADDTSTGELFPSVPANTITDVSAPRVSLERNLSPSPAEFGSTVGAGSAGKLALAAGALGLLIAASAGWLAWEAQVDVAAMHERLGSLQSSASAVQEGSNPDTLGNELASLSRRVDALVGSAGEGDKEELASVRAELESLTQRLGGLDARLEALTAQVGRSDTAAPAQEEKDAPVRSGSWAVNLASFADRATAHQELERIRAKGIDAEVAPAPADGRTWYRIRVPGFASAALAKRFVKAKAAPAGFGKAWVGPQ